MSSSHSLRRRSSTGGTTHWPPTAPAKRPKRQPPKLGVAHRRSCRQDVGWLNVRLAEPLPRSSGLWRLIRGVLVGNAVEDVQLDFGVCGRLAGIDDCRVVLLPGLAA